MNPHPARASRTQASCRQLADLLVEHWPAALDGIDHDPFARRERAGWFHASDMNDGGPVHFDPRFCIEQYLGRDVRKPFDSCAAWAVLQGLFIDTAAKAAMQRAGAPFVEVEPCLQDPVLRFSGQPDFVVEAGGRRYVGDVKSTDARTFRQHFANPDWDLSRAYFWRQLQSYLLLAELAGWATDRGLLIVVDRSGPSGFERDDDALRACFHVRVYRRDERVIEELREDLERLGRWAARIAAAETRGADPELLLRQVPRRFR